MAVNDQLGFAEETTYGTAVTPTRFAEFNSESLNASYARIESNAVRAGTGRLYRSDTRFTTYLEGVSGDIEMEVGSKGFGLWLKHMLGTAAAPVGPTDGTYTHTFTPGTLPKGMTVQVTRTQTDESAQRVFTYGGCKVTSWELSNSNDGNLMATISLDGANETTATAKATATYPTGLETFSWVGGSLTVGGTSVPVSEVSISGDNALNVDRRRLRNNPQKYEPTASDFRSGEFSFTADFNDLTLRDKVASATAAGALATVVAKWEGKTLIGATTYPSLTVTLNGRLDTFEASVSGTDEIMQALTGQYLGASPISVAYVTLDATP